VADCTMGVVVDGVSDVLALTRDQMKPVPAFGAGIDTQYITGLGSIDERILILVDIERLMTGADMALIESETA